MPGTVSALSFLSGSRRESSAYMQEGGIAFTYPRLLLLASDERLRWNIEQHSDHLDASLQIHERRFLRGVASPSPLLSAQASRLPPLSPSQPLSCDRPGPVAFTLSIQANSTEDHTAASWKDSLVNHFLVLPRGDCKVGFSIFCSITIRNSSVLDIADVS